MSAYEQGSAHRRTLAAMYADFSDSELDMLVHAAERTGLDPMTRQIYASKRISREDDGGRKVTISVQATIDGFRAIAERSGTYQGQTAPQWCGADGVWRDVWLSDSEPPSAARVGVWRAGWREPLYAVARWGAYVQMRRDGTPNRMWATMGDVMLAKCAEALALRKAFPVDLSGIYTSDEMGQADNERIAPVLGEEEQRRAEQQRVTQGRAAPDEAKLIGDSWINEFRALTHVDDVVQWIETNVGAWDVSDKRQRPRVYKACETHVNQGHVEGLSVGGFREAWGHHLRIARGELNAPAATAQDAPTEAA